MSNMPSPTVSIPWPVTSTLLDSELALMQQIVNRWKDRFGSEEFLKELDELDDDERSQLFGQFINELKVLASKSATLVEVLA